MGRVPSCANHSTNTRLDNLPVVPQTKTKWQLEFTQNTHLVWDVTVGKIPEMRAKQHRTWNKNSKNVGPSYLTLYVKQYCNGWKWQLYSYKYITPKCLCKAYQLPVVYPVVTVKM